MRLNELGYSIVFLLFVEYSCLRGTASVFIVDKNQTFIENQNVTLYCNTSSFSGNVTWMKNGDSDVKSTTNTLYFQQIQRQNDGRYICNATNGTSYFTDEIHISVKYPPSIQLIDHHIVLENTSVSFACNATGSPSPDVTFFKDGKPLSSALEQVTLKFKSVSRYKTGQYRCIAYNGIGRNATATTYLDVQYPPKVTMTAVHPISAWIGKHVRTRCNVTANPPANITWYKDKTTISHKHELALDITLDHQFGTYRCLAGNSHGNDSGGVVLRRTRFPPSSPEITNNDTTIQSRNFTLTWSKSEGNGSPVTNYSVYKQQMYENGSRGNLEEHNVSSSLTELRFLLVWGAKYQFFVSARNDQGETQGQSKNFTVIKEPQALPPPQSKLGISWIVIVACSGGALMLVIIFVVAVICFCRKKTRQTPPKPCQKEPNFNHRMLMEDMTPKPSERYDLGRDIRSQNQPKSSEPEETPPETGTPAIYDNVAFVDKSVEGWEIPRENVNIEKVIGKGAFCQVAKAFVIGIGTVAVKMIRTKGNGQTSNREDLLAEYKLLQNLGIHPNVIMVMGGVTTSDPIMVLFEYVPYGDLLGYLRRSRGLTDTYYSDPDYQPSSSLTSKQLLRFAREISDGMAFIASKKIIHRDLAARNVLVGQDETCKITDFGMARDVKNDDIYQKKKRGRLPVKWTAYEALLYGFYSTQSDVWSYAIVLYEIFTIGGSPYPDMDPRKLAQKIHDGYRMPKPGHLDDDIYALMTECWKTSPDHRPSFTSISSTLRRLQRCEKDFIQMNQYDVNLYANLDEL